MKLQISNNTPKLIEHFHTLNDSCKVSLINGVNLILMDHGKGKSTNAISIKKYLDKNNIDSFLIKDSDFLVDAPYSNLGLSDKTLVHLKILLERFKTENYKPILILDDFFGVLDKDGIFECINLLKNYESQVIVFSVYSLESYILDNFKNEINLIKI